MKMDWNDAGGYYIVVGYIYITTNLVNNMKYIGKHKSSELQLHKYFGSGARIRQALHEYGRKNFKCEVLEVCDSIEQLNQQEIYWIAKYNATEREDFYNVADGGVGSSGKVFGQVIKQAWETEEYRNSHVIGNLRYWQNAENRVYRTERNQQADHKSAWTEDLKSKQRNIQKQVWDNPILKQKHSMILKSVWSDPQKIEQQRQNNMGTKNPSYGKHYYVDGHDNWIFCKPDNVPQGYYRAKYVWIYKGNEKLRHEKGKPIPIGWSLDK